MISSPADAEQAAAGWQASCKQIPPVPSIPQCVLEKDSMLETHGLSLISQNEKNSEVREGSWSFFGVPHKLQMRELKIGWQVQMKKILGSIQ